MLLLVPYFVLSIAVCSSENLPPCPPYVQYQPKDMPLNCILPGPAMMPFPPGLPPPMQGSYPFFPSMFPPPMMNMTYLKSPSNSKFRYPLPHPIPQPVGMPMMPMPPMPIMQPISPNGPIIVVPYYSRKSSNKNSNNHPKSLHPKENQKTEECFDDDAAAENKIKRKRHLVVTPMLSYVTKEGYVIYKKILSDKEALRWIKKEIKQLKNKKHAKKRMDDEENHNQDIITERKEKSEEIKKDGEDGETDANKEDVEENQPDNIRRLFAAAELSDGELSFSRSLKRKIEKNLRRKVRLFKD